MSYSDQYTSTPFDQALADTPGLSWVPWVGTNYANLPVGRKVVVIAESHYSNEQDSDKAQDNIEERSNDKAYTRAVVSQSLVNQQWTTRTLSTLHKLFYSPADRGAFWNDVAYFNIIQRPMWYRDGNPERPTGQDFENGWKAVLQVLDILEPDHVLFIGVEAARSFNSVMIKNGHDHVAVEWKEKVGSAYARTASLSINGREIPLHFIKHCGSYFSTDNWSNYLHRNAPALMASLAKSAGVEPHIPVSRQLHVLGMAKSSLDLRGAKAPKLELDFLRLAYVVRDLQEAGDEAIGYLMVLTPSVAKTAESWRDKYGTGESIVILYEEITAADLEDLIKEKSNNAIGMIKDHRFAEADHELPLADRGKALGESALLKTIEQRHPGITSATKPPLGISWDYYGTLDTPPQS